MRGDVHWGEEILLAITYRNLITTSFCFTTKVTTVLNVKLTFLPLLVSASIHAILFLSDNIEIFSREFSSLLWVTQEFETTQKVTSNICENFMVFNFKWNAAQGLCTMTALCTRCFNSTPSAINGCPVFDKDKY